MTTAEELIENAEALLLDFDGPVTALMPPPLNSQAAESVRRSLEGLEVPADVQVTTDHLAVLRWTAENAARRLVEVERASTEAEIACAQASQPSPEVDWLLETAENRGIPVAVVSNNSEEAVRTFVDRYAWTTRIAAYACRTPEVARLLKPNPFLVTAAVELLNVRGSECVFIGDSVSDVEAGLLAGVRVVGLAKTQRRGEELLRAGAHALLTRP